MRDISPEAPPGVNQLVSDDPHGSSYESLRAGDDEGTVMRKLAKKQRRAQRIATEARYQCNTDWMSTVGAGVEPKVYLNHNQAQR